VKLTETQWEQNKVYTDQVYITTKSVMTQFYCYATQMSVNTNCMYLLKCQPTAFRENLSHSAAASCIRYINNTTQENFTLHQGRMTVEAQVVVAEWNEIEYGSRLSGRPALGSTPRRSLTMTEDMAAADADWHTGQHTQRAPLTANVPAHSVTHRDK